jgi:uncharacterized protein
VIWLLRRAARGHTVAMDSNDIVLTHTFANPANRTIAKALPKLGVTDGWLASGCVFQSVWNGLSGRPSNYGILDYDVFYFDPDTSYEAEDRVIQRCATAFAGLGVEVQVRNQARVHLWYPEKFGRPYPAVTSIEDALRRFLAPACAVAVRLDSSEGTVLAPFGLSDLVERRIRRNPSTSGPEREYEAKAARWKAAWPEITVEPWNGHA